jgi:hypothetical protein
LSTGGGNSRFSGSRVLGSQFAVRAPKQNTGERRTPNAERRTPNAERRTPNAERRTPNAERRTPNAEEGYFTVPNVNTVCDEYFWPGRRIVDGNFGRFGESGKCCVSRQKPVRSA